MRPTRGGVLLRDWLERERRSQEWLAEQIGVHQTTVSGWIRGTEIKARPAALVEEITGIPISEWSVLLHSTGTDGE